MGMKPLNIHFFPFHDAGFGNNPQLDKVFVIRYNKTERISIMTYPFCYREVILFAIMPIKRSFFLYAQGAGHEDQEQD